MFLFMLIIGCLTLLVCLALLFLRTQLLIVTVKQKSMHPTLEHGDRVLLLRRWITRRLTNMERLPDFFLPACTRLEPY